MGKHPFQFGQLMDSQSFVNRKTDLERLHRNLSQGIHSVLIAPRRWGKSSLVNELAVRYKSPELVFCQIDLFSMREENEFFEILSRAVVNATHTKIEHAIDNLRRWASHIAPRISLTHYPDHELGIDFDFRNQSIDKSSLLDLPEQIAKEKNIRLVLCVDEFQNIEYLSESLPFQKLLRSHWQRHKHVSYLLYGSKRHMLSQLFQKQSFPFYKFGQVMYLEKIPAVEFQQHLVNGFKEQGKSITADQADAVIQLMLNQPYYVQQFAFLLLNHTGTTVNLSSLDKTMQEFISQGYPFYQRMFESLSNMQVNLMNALAAGDPRPMNSNAFLRDYRLNSSANVTRALQGLEEKEIIDRFGKSIEIMDPGFRLWWQLCLQQRRPIAQVTFNDALRNLHA